MLSATAVGFGPARTRRAVRGKVQPAIASLARAWPWSWRPPVARRRPRATAFYVAYPHHFSVGICIAMLVVTAGCVSSGYRFTRPQPETLVLGKTTYKEVVREVGEPLRTGTVVKNDQPLKVDAVLCRGQDATGQWRLIGMRGMFFYFLDDALVGYHYTSTFSDDKTDFDDAKAYQLKKGQTTRSQVIELLGRPSGMYIYPMISSKMDTALVYFYLGITRKGLGRPEPTQKRLVVSFDAQDLVTGVEFGPGGER